MAIPVVNYAALPVQGDPMMAGLIDAIQKGMKLGYMPKQQKQQSQANDLANALQQIQLQYAAPMAQEELLGRQQRNQFYPQDIQSQIDARKAGTNLTNEELKYLPLKNAIEATNASRQNSRFGDAYQLSVALKNMPAASRAQWIADNGDEYLQMVNALGNKTKDMQGNQGNDLLAQMMSKYFGGQPLTINPNQAQQQQMINSGMASQGQLSPVPDMQKLPGGLNPGFSSNPEQIDKFKLASQLAANNYLTTSPTRRQMEGALQVENIINDPGFQERALNASNYAGALGKGKKYTDALFQQNPKAYTDYLGFMNSDMVLLENRIKTLDQMGATDAQREELKGLYSKAMNSMTSNPEQFITQLNNLGSALDNVARSVEKSAMPLGGKSRLQGFNPIGEAKNINNDSLEYTAKKYGIPIDEVKRRLGIS